MDRSTALAVFDALDKAKLYSPEDMGAKDKWNPPTFHVRLDATTDHNGDRDFSVRVTVGAETGGIDTDDWHYVFTVAAERGLAADVQNSGVELR